MHVYVASSTNVDGAQPRSDSRRPVRKSRRCRTCPIGSRTRSSSGSWPVIRAGRCRGRRTCPTLRSHLRPEPRTSSESSPSWSPRSFGVSSFHLASKRSLSPSSPCLSSHSMPAPMSHRPWASASPLRRCSPTDAFAHRERTHADASWRLADHGIAQALVIDGSSATAIAPLTGSLVHLVDHEGLVLSNYLVVDDPDRAS